MQKGIWSPIRLALIFADLLVIFAISLILPTALASKDEAESSFRHQQRQERDDDLGLPEIIKPQCEVAIFHFKTLLLTMSHESISCQQRCQNEIDRLKKLYQSATEPDANIFGEPLPLFIDICQALPGAVLQVLDFKDLSVLEPDPSEQASCETRFDYCARPTKRLRMSIGCECSSKLQFLLFSSEWLQQKTIIPGTVPRGGSLAAVFLQQDICNLNSIHIRLKDLFQIEGLGLPEPSTQLSNPYPCIDLQNELMRLPGWFSTWIQSPDDGLATVQTYVESAQGPLQRWYHQHYGTEGYDETDGIHSRPALGRNLQIVTSLDSVIDSSRARLAMRTPGASIDGEMMIPEDCPWSVVKDAQSFGSGDHGSRPHTNTDSGDFSQIPSSKIYTSFHGDLWKFQLESYVDEHNILDAMKRLSADIQYPFSDEDNVAKATNEEATSRRRIGSPSLHLTQTMPSSSEHQNPAVTQAKPVEDDSYDILALWNAFMDHDFQLGPFL